MKRKLYTRFSSAIPYKPDWLEVYRFFDIQILRNEFFMYYNNERNGNMKKRLLKVLTVVLFASHLLTLCGCNGYSSSYRAVAFGHSNTTKSAFVSFLSFESSMVFKLKCESEDEKLPIPQNRKEAAQKSVMTVTVQNRKCVPSIPAKK